MKTLHVHLNVDDLDQAIGFYSNLFGAAPDVQKHDYAKWAVADPRVNFAVSSRGKAAGFDHLGIEVEDNAALDEMEGRLQAAEAEILSQRDATCCYAKSDKAWSFDPQGIPWEVFSTFGESEDFGADTLATAQA